MKSLEIIAIKGRYGFAKPTDTINSNLVENHWIYEHSPKPLVRVLLATDAEKAQQYLNKSVEIECCGRDGYTGLPLFNVPGVQKELTRQQYNKRYEKIFAEMDKFFSKKD